jgi:hypothetical protein
MQKVAETRIREHLDCIRSSVPCKLPAHELEAINQCSIELLRHLMMPPIIACLGQCAKHNLRTT